MNTKRTSSSLFGLISFAFIDTFPDTEDLEDDRMIKPAKKPVKKSSRKPAGKKGKKPAGKKNKKPARGKKPAKKPAKKPVKKPSRKPAGKKGKNCLLYTSPSPRD